MLRGDGLKDAQCPILKGERASRQVSDPGAVFLLADELDQLANAKCVAEATLPSCVERFDYQTTLRTRDAETLRLCLIQDPSYCAQNGFVAVLPHCVLHLLLPPRPMA